MHDSGQRIALTVLPSGTDHAPQDALARIARASGADVRASRHDRMLYATDASLYQVEPLGVVIPKTVEGARRAVEACAREGLAMLPRGGGTSLAGQCTNRAVVIDLSMHCTALLSVDEQRRVARVEPGLTVDDLNDRLAPRGLFFAPDPATARHANIGGCIGNNAAGSRSILYGRTSENVVAIDACLSDGTRMECRAKSTDPRAREISLRVADVVVRHERLIRERFPRTIRRNAGYGLDVILSQLDRGVARDALNLAPLLCGSEGTLAVTLGATLLLRERPASRGLAVIGLGDLDEAIALVRPILSTGPSAVELLDDLILNLASANAEYAPLVRAMPSPAPGSPLKAVLYVEYVGTSHEEVEERFAGLSRLLAAERPRTCGAPAFHREAQAMLGAWKLRKAGEPLLHGVPGSRKPITFIEDNAVPVERLGEFVRRLREIMTRHGTIASYWAHASVGVLHVRPLLDIHVEQDRERMRSIAVEVADLARELGGVMSGEHGDGRVRGPLLERFYGPELMGAFREVKRVFDPRNLLNPGNIVDLAGERTTGVLAITEHLRVEPQRGRPASVPEGVRTFYDYQREHGFDSAVEMCNGAGICRKKQGGTMCPSYMGTLDERHSTRGRGNALRLAITGQFNGGSAWNDPDTLQTLDLCLSCKACKTECPSNVDIAKLKSEYLAQGYQHEPAPLRVRLLGAVRTLNRLGSITPGLANAASRLALVRAMMNHLLDMHPSRSVPRFERSLASRWNDADVGARTSEPDAPCVALFGDCFTMYNEPGIGTATKRVLEAFGYRVVLADAGCCGRAKISLGLLPQAIEEIDQTLKRLRPLIDDGRVRAVLVAEPSCLSAMKDDWISLKSGTSRALRERLAAKAYLPEDFLNRFWEHHPRRAEFKVPDQDVLLHAHCHQKALWGAGTSADMLRRIAGDRLRVLDSGCCGMAGAFGISREKFDLSMKIGELTLLPAVRALSTHSDVCAPGTSCRHQIHDGTQREALHPMQLLEKWLRA